MSDERFGGIEASDINDREILQQTKQLKRPKDGAIQFKYTCDDGHLITSEWINPEQARKALMMWCDVVRNTVAARAKELAASKKSPIIVVDEDMNEHEDIELEEEVSPEPVRPRRPAAATRPKPVVVRDEPEEEVETDDDVLLIKALKAKRRKLQGKIDKLDMILETLQD